MGKTNDDRAHDALDAIRSIVGEDEANDIDQKLSAHPQRDNFLSALSIGGVRIIKKDAETQRRNAVRALLLTGLILGQIKLIAFQAAQTEFMGLSIEELKRRLIRAFPFKPFSGQFANRSQWAPGAFTTPSRGLFTQYRFIVHAIMPDPSKVATFGLGSTTTQQEWDDALKKYRQSLQTVKGTNAGNPALHKKELYINFAREYLQNPNIIQRNIISASIISDQHHSTYYPFGFILDVPPVCIYSTSSKDQSVANRTGDAVGELARVHHNKGGGSIAAPSDILDNTTGANGYTGYNEIVLVGRSPEGAVVSVSGIFIKVHPNGNYYVDPRKKTPHVTPELEKLIKGCSATKGIPVVKIVDKSSADSAFAIPF